MATNPKINAAALSDYHLEGLADDLNRWIRRFESMNMPDADIKDLREMHRSVTVEVTRRSYPNLPVTPGFRGGVDAVLGTDEEPTGPG